MLETTHTKIKYNIKALINFSEFLKLKMIVENERNL